MPRIDATKLIEVLLAPPERPGLRFFLCDDGFFRHLGEEKLGEKMKQRPALFVGNNAIEQFVDAAAMGNLFAPAPPAIIELDPKPTAKELARAFASLARLPKPPEAIGYFFAPTPARNSYKEPDLSKFGEVFLCYSPNEAEAVRCALLLTRRYRSIAGKPASEQQVLAAKATHYYSCDLLACDKHFERMDRLGVDFEAALVVQTEVNAFHVVDALASGNSGLVELRLQQCLSSGEEPGGILQAIVFFLKQLAQVQVRLESNQSLDVALRDAGVPFPSHDRIRRALKTIPPDRLAHFFLCAPNLELAMRTQKQPHAWLGAELIGLLQKS